MTPPVDVDVDDVADIRDAVDEDAAPVCDACGAAVPLKDLVVAECLSCATGFDAVRLPDDGPPRLLAAADEPEAEGEPAVGEPPAASPGDDATADPGGDDGDGDLDDGGDEAADSSGARVARGAGAALALPAAVGARAAKEAVKGGAEAVDRVLPASSSAYRALAGWCVSRMQQSTGADAVGLVADENGQLAPVPVKRKRRRAEPGDPQPGGWRALGDDRVWQEAAAGEGLLRWGTASVALFDGGGGRRIRPLEGRVRNALDRGDWQHVFRIEDPGAVEINPVVRDADMQRQGGPALADGGADIEIQPPKSAVLEDTLVDISPDPGTAGEQISLTKVRDATQGEPAPEQLEEQRQLGFTAAMLRKDDQIKSLLMKLALLFVIGLVGGLAVLTLGPEVLASSGATDAASSTLPGG